MKAYFEVGYGEMRTPASVFLIFANEFLLLIFANDFLLWQWISLLQEGCLALGEKTNLCSAFPELNVGSKFLALKSS